MRRVLHRYGYELLTIRAIARRTQVDRCRLGELLSIGFSVEDAVDEARAASPAKRGARRYLFRGAWMTVYEAMERTGLSQTTIRGRISGDRILERDEAIDPYVPGRVDAALVTYKGETHSVTEWAKIVGLSRETIFSRLFNGWPAHEALFKPPRLSGRGAPKARNRTLLKRIFIGFRRARNQQLIHRISTAFAQAKEVCG